MPLTRRRTLRSARAPASKPGLLVSLCAQLTTFSPVFPKIFLHRFTDSVQDSLWASSGVIVTGSKQQLHIRRIMEACKTERSSCNCVKSWAFAYAIPAYVYPLEETPSAGARIYVKCIRTGLYLHVVGGDSAMPVSDLF